MKRRDLLTILPLLATSYLLIGHSRCAHAGWPNTSETDPPQSDTKSSWPNSSATNAGRSNASNGIHGCAIHASGQQSSLNIPPIMRDANVHPTLVGKAHAFNEMLKSVYNLSPGLAFIDDTSSPNAFATSENLLPTSKHGTILLGIKIINLEFNKGPGTWEGAVALIHAHEFGHIAQFNHSYLGPTPVMELQADALAGCAIANALILERINLSQLNYLQALQLTQQRHLELSHASNSLFQMGSYDFNNPNFHGTPNQRVRAFMEGFKFITQRTSPTPISAVMNATRTVAMQIMN